MSKRLGRAEQRARTREQLLEAGERLFVGNGFHATTVDAVAAEAGFTKGAVYSNFASKEELFLAIYERRVAHGVAQIERAIRRCSALEGLSEVARRRAKRTKQDDLWIALLFEFWAHVVRKPRARERFVELHDQALQPLAKGIERLAAEEGVELPLPPERFARAMNGMLLGVILERLIQPTAMKVGDGAHLVVALAEALKRKGLSP